MLLRFVETRGFSQAAKASLSDEELRAVQLALITNPEAGSTIGKTGGAGKIRAALAGRGKRGGARVIYFYSPRTTTIYLLYVYAKNDADDLTDTERKVSESDHRSVVAGRLKLYDVIEPQHVISQSGRFRMSKTARQHAAALIASAQEALAIARGKQGPARTYTARDVLVEAPPKYSANEIRAIREAIHVSQQVFADMLNVSDKTVHAWEQGSREPEGPTLRLLELAKHEPSALMCRVTVKRDAKHGVKRHRDSHPPRHVSPHRVALKQQVRVAARKRG